MMSNREEERRAEARQRAQRQFTASQQREDSIRAEIEKERSRNANKMAKLKALRLAKEASTQEPAETAKPKGRDRTKGKR